MAPVLRLAFICACLVVFATARRPPSQEVTAAEERAHAAHDMLLDVIAGLVEAAVNASEGNASASSSHGRHLQSDGGPCRVDRSRMCIDRCWVDFRNGQGSNKLFGWAITAGQATMDWEGLRMYSSSQGSGIAGANSRMHYDGGDARDPFYFNTVRNPKTSIMAWVRGAPDGGKNSNVYLMESKGGSMDGIQANRIDEVDLVEIYGGRTGGNAAEMTVYSNMGWPTQPWVAGPAYQYSVSSPGRNDYMYELVLERGRYLKMWAFHPSNRGNILGQREYFTNVPDSPMRLYSGIWDCSSDQSWCPGWSGNLVTSMVLKGIWIHNCY